MKVQLNLQGMSQFSNEVHPKYQRSACGPTTTYVILKYLLGDEQAPNVNTLYKKLGTTKIGLFKWRMVKNLQKLLGPNWTVQKCSLKEALHELDEGRPVAMKFDRYFSFQWRKRTSFKYHWTPLIGYEMEDDKLYLILHDNGWKNRDSVIRKVPYGMNAKVLTFIKIKPKKP